MTNKDFIQLLKNHNLLHVRSEQELKELVQQYPYCQSLRFLYVKKLQQRELPAFEYELIHASCHATDRQFLYQFIHFSSSEEPVIETTETSVIETKEYTEKPNLVIIKNTEDEAVHIDKEIANNSSSDNDTQIDLTPEKEIIVENEPIEFSNSEDELIDIHPLELSSAASGKEEEEQEKIEQKLTENLPLELNIEDVKEEEEKQEMTLEEVINGEAEIEEKTPIELSIEIPEKEEDNTQESSNNIVSLDKLENIKNRLSSLDQSFDTLNQPSENLPQNHTKTSFSKEVNTQKTEKILEENNPMPSFEFNLKNQGDLEMEQQEKAITFLLEQDAGESILFDATLDMNFMQNEIPIEIEHNTKEEKIKDTEGNNDFLNIEFNLERTTNEPINLIDDEEGENMDDLPLSAFDIIKQIEQAEIDDDFPEEIEFSAKQHFTKKEDVNPQDIVKQIEEAELLFEEMEENISDDTNISEEERAKIQSLGIIFQNIKAINIDLISSNDDDDIIEKEKPFELLIDTSMEEEKSLELPVKISTIEPIIVVDIEENEDKTQEFIEEIEPVEPSPIVSTEPTKIDGKLDFSSWLQRLKPPSVEPKEQKKRIRITQDKLKVKKSTKTSRKSKKAHTTSPKSRKKNHEIIELARNSITDNDEIISETLADILAKQGKKSKAIRMYKQLSLKNPEKNAYFAGKIKKLKNK